jgi:hypothetical protein
VRSVQIRVKHALGRRLSLDLRNDTQIIARTLNQSFTETPCRGKCTGLTNKIIQITLITRSNFAVALDDLV